MISVRLDGPVLDPLPENLETRRSYKKYKNQKIILNQNSTVLLWQSTNAFLVDENVKRLEDAFSVNKLTKPIFKFLRKAPELFWLFVQRARSRANDLPQILLGKFPNSHSDI